MGLERRARAAERLAQALAHGDGPTDLRTLLVHGPIASPSFERAPTLRLARLEQAMALEHAGPQPEEPELARDDEDEPVTSQLRSQTIDEGEPVIASARPAVRRGLVVAAAAVALAVGGLVAAAVVAGMRTERSGPALAAELASPPHGEAGELVDDHAPPGLVDDHAPPGLVDDHAPPGLVDDHEAGTVPRVELLPAPVEPRPEPEEDETIVVLDESSGPSGAEGQQRRRTATSLRARSSRVARRPRAAGLVTEAGSALEAGARVDAIDLYERALTVDPRLAAAAAGLSTAYFDLGRFDHATAWAEQAVKTDFRNADYHVLLGDAYYRNAALDDARLQWQTAAKLGSPRADDRLAKLDE
jgi:hypothetical protein